MGLFLRDIERYHWEENRIDPITNVVDVYGNGVERLDKFSLDHQCKSTFEKKEKKKMGQGIKIRFAERAE
jgi:hypothetical protein